MAYDVVEPLTTHTDIDMLQLLSIIDVNALLTSDIQCITHSHKRQWTFNLRQNVFELMICQSQTIEAFSGGGINGVVVCFTQFPHLQRLSFFVLNTHRHQVTPVENIDATGSGNPLISVMVCHDAVDRLAS